MTPYQRCLLIALIKFKARTTDEIIVILKKQGWTGTNLIPEVIERILDEFTVWPLVRTQ